jgi:pimeloyl-ACP methyl ester carboxylesterase
VDDACVTLPDGRALSYADIGERRGRFVFFFHGAPISRLHLSYLEKELARQGVRVIAPDRPSYGRSSPQPGRTLADWPNDVAALADALGVDRFVVAGHSSGGPYAVACAALMPHRVLGGLVFGGVTDAGWREGLSGFIPSERAIMSLPDERSALAWCVEQFGADGSRFRDASAIQFGEPDSALFADPHAGAAIDAAVTEAFAQGISGYAQDIFVQGRPWPFDPRAITAPMLLVHGECDQIVPVAHSRHTAAVTGGALHLLPGHGHMTTLAELPRMAAE